MNSPKINKTFLTALIIFILISAAGSFLWYTTSNSLSEVRQAIEQEKSALTKIQNRANFPSENNIKAFETVIGKIETDISVVRQILQESKVPGESIPGDVFQTRFARMKQQLIEACQSLGITIPENFQFAFSFYATNTPSREDTEALTQQLGIIENLTRILIDARVNRITSFKRMIVEKNLPSGVVLEAGGGLTSLRATQAAGQDFFPPIPSNEQLRYNTLPFILEFESDENSLRRIINDLSRPPSLNQTDKKPYFVIRALELTNSKTTLPTLDVLRASSAQEDAISQRQSTTMAAPAQASIAPKIVVGNELVQTRMRVDYIEFKQSQQDAVVK